MKRNDVFILLATAAYSYLFYNQSAGINFAILSLLLVIMLAYSQRGVAKKRSWQVVAAGTIISSITVMWWGTDLPVFANVISLLAMAGITYNAQNSFLVGFINGVFSSALSFLVSINDIFKPRPQHNDTDGVGMQKLFLIAVPLLVVFSFFVTYQAANPVFSKLLDNINFDFINAGWVVFTISGLVLFTGVFRFYAWHQLSNFDMVAPSQLSAITLEQHLQSPLGSWLPVNREILTGVITFVLLNILLLAVNSIDISCLWIVKQLPAGVTMVEYLHSGTYTLIFSIVMAIVVIMVIFRGYINFVNENKIIKRLAYAWILQNVILIITTAGRNWYTIESSGLTRKRIGVYVYLILCLIGLVTTLIKVARKKSNWFLFQCNSWMFYAVLIVTCAINWDALIVNYNYNHYISADFEYVDRGYQTELSHTALGTLYSLYYNEQNVAANKHNLFTKQMLTAMKVQYNYLDADINSSGWQSYCVSKRSNYNAVSNILSAAKDSTMLAPVH